MADSPSQSEHSRTIRDRSLSGIRWTTAQTVFVALIGPFSQIVKARFLVPEELGVVAVFMIVYGLLHTVENAGIGQSIVQKDFLDSAELFTFLVVAAAAGLLGAATLVLIAEPVAQLFGSPTAAQLIRLSGPLLLCALVDQYFRAVLHRHLLFRGAAVLESGKRVLNLTLLLVFLGVGLGPAGVAYAMLVSTFVGATGLGIIAVRSGHLRLQFRWATSATTHLVRFGLPIAGKQVFSYVTHRADELMIGVFLEPAALGVYHLAKETLQRLQAVITGSFSRVLLSLFSRIRDDKSRLTAVYKRISLVVSYVGISVFVGIALTADSVVPAVFGTEWVEAIPAFRVLAIALVPIVVTANLSSSLLYSVGKSSSVLLADFWINVPYLVLLVFFGRSGLTPVLFLYTAYCYSKGIVLQVMSNRQLTMTTKTHLMVYVRVLSRVMAMALAVGGADLAVGPQVSAELRVLVLVTVGVVSMGLVTFLTDRPLLREMRVVMGNSQ